MAQQDSLGSTVRHRFSASSSYLTQFGAGAGSLGGGDQEMDVIMLDHCYSKPWSAHPDASNARPVRMLFMPKQTRPSTLEMLQRHVDPPIDVVDAPPAPSMPFDINKARNLMTECERHASYARPDSQEDWEDKICRAGWTIQQNRAFNKVIKALQADRLARLAMDSVANEPIARRQLVDKTAKRLRQALASVGWDMSVVQWLHQLILDTVSIHLLACYLDALQTLKSKVPSLVEKMVSGTPPKHPSLSQESLGLLLKRPWDPIGNALTQQKLRRLPLNPLLLLAPSGPTQGSSSTSGQAKRLKFWQAHLNNLGKVIPVNLSGGSGVSMVLCMEQMIGALRTKVLEQKSHSQNRPIVLVGWNIGALVSCHVSLVESVSAVVCLGFPFTGIHGPRGDCEDSLLASQTPTLFVIGQNASDCSIDQLQDLREHMRAETGMLVVGGADEQLRLSHRQKREEGLTQAMADRCIIDEVCQFLGSILSMSAGPAEHPPADVAPLDPRRKRKRKVSQLIGVNPLDSNLPASLGFDATDSAPPVLGTGRVSKRGGKAARQMAAAGGVALPTERSRAAPKKRQARGGMGAGARKRMALGVGQLGMRATRAPSNFQSANTTTISAVSSAPELYGLLQGFGISRPNEGDPVVFGGARSLMSTSFPRTKLLAFSKVKDQGDAGSSGSVPATLLASAIRSGDSSDKDRLAQQQQQQQILVRTGGSPGAPLTIPITMTPRLVAGSLAGNSPMVHITGSTSSTHIHQLLTSSIARSAISTATTAAVSQTALLINTTVASAASSVPSSLTVQSAIGEKAVPDKAEQSKNSATQKLIEKTNGADVKAGQGQKEVGQDTMVASIQNCQYHDFPLTTASLTNPAMVLTQASLTNPTTVLTQASLANPATALTQASLTNPATMLTQASLANPATTLTQTSLANPSTVLTQASLANPSSALTQASLANSATVLIQAKSGESHAGSPATTTRPTVMQLAVTTKSLISSASSCGSSILGKVVAGSVAQAGRAGSPIATSSILGARSAVLISTSIAKCLSSAPTATLLGRPSSEPGSPGAAFVINQEMLGKVSSVLEPSASVRRASQSSAGTMSVVKGPFPLTKTGVINALSVSKPPAGLTSSQASPLVSVGGSSPVPATSMLVTTTATASTSTCSGGTARGGHKSGSSVSYAASAKPVLPTVASTRTRRIRTPKQYDL